MQCSGRAQHRQLHAVLAVHAVGLVVGAVADAHASTASTASGVCRAPHTLHCIWTAVPETRDAAMQRS